MGLIHCAIIRPGEVNKKFGQKIPFHICSLESVRDPEVDHVRMEAWGIQVLNAQGYFLLISGTESKSKQKIQQRRVLYPF